MPGLQKDQPEIWEVKCNFKVLGILIRFNSPRCAGLGKVRQPGESCCRLTVNRRVAVNVHVIWNLPLFAHYMHRRAKGTTVLLMIS